MNKEIGKKLEKEKGDRKERLPVSSSGEDQTREALKIAENVFEGWDAQGYLEFYGPLPVEIIEPAFHSIKELIRKKTGEDCESIDTIDLGELASRLNSMIVEKSLEIEDAENLVLYHFMMNEVMPRILEERPEDNLSVLDVGSGPTIYQFILMAGLAGKIQPAEFDADNRRELSRWLEGNGHDWSSYFQAFGKGLIGCKVNAAENVISRLKGFVDNPANIENYVRNILADPVETDVFAPDLGLPEGTVYDLVSLEKKGFEVVSSNFCVESAFNQDLNKWREGMTNIAQKVAPEGYLVMTAITGSDWYRDGSTKIPATNVNSEMVAECLTDLGFEIRYVLDMKGQTIEDAKKAGRLEEDYSGYSGMSCILAKKGAK